MHFRDRALAGRRGRDRNRQQVGQLGQLRPGARGVHPIAGDDHRARGGEERVGHLPHVGRRGLRHAVRQVSRRLVNPGRPPGLHRAAERAAAEDDRHGPRRARRRVLDGELDRLDGLLGLGDRRGVLGRAREQIAEIVIAVLAGAGLVGRVVHEGRHVREVAEQQHRRRALHRLERAEERVTREEDALAHDDAGLAGEPAVHLRHDRAHLLVADQDRLDRLRVVERVEDASGVAAGHAEDELDARLLEDADDGVGNVDLVGNHEALRLSATAAWKPSARPRPSPGTWPR